MAYRTENICVAATLRLLGHPMQHIEMNGRKATFIFDESLKELAVSIALATGPTVQPTRYHNEVRDLTSLIASIAPKRDY